MRVLGVSVLLASAFALGACGGSSSASKAVAPKAAPAPLLNVWSDNDAAIPVSSDDPTWGDRDAPVTLVEFADFQCHYCGKVEPTLAALKQAYGPHKLRIVWKSLPLVTLHPDARAAAEAAEGVFMLTGNDGFWSFHDAIFANQGGLSRDAYIGWATAAGVHDIDGFKKGLDGHIYGLKVNQDVELAGAIGLHGTPAFFINAVFIEGAERLARFQRVIDGELVKAEAKIAVGTPKDRVYVAMSRENAAHPPNDEAEDDDDEDTTTVWKMPATGPARGGASPLVTIVEFGDFEDRFTRRAELTMTALRTKYGDDLRIVWMNEPLPSHARATAAAKLTVEARTEKGDAAFWAVHDALLAKPAIDDAALDAIASDAGLDATKTHAAMQPDTACAALDADLDVMDDFEALGTPTFFIDGRRLVGAHSQKRFQSIIDDEMTKAKGLVAAGTPRAGVYDALLKDAQPPPPEKRAVGPAPTSPWKGSAKAKVVVEIFSDFECPFCGRVEPTLKDVMKAYGDRIKLVWRNLPLPMHPFAPLAAEAAMEAYAEKGNDGFWKMHDALFSNQDDLKRETLDGYAKDFGLDAKKWAAALDGSTHAAQIEADGKAAEETKITGTPAFVVFAGDAATGGTGYFIGGAHPYVHFRKIIERALAEAR